MVFWLILVALVGFDVLWWLWADRRLRRLPCAGRWRAALGLFMALQLGGFAALVLFRGFRLPAPMPTALLAGIYIWHLAIAPITLAMLGVSGLGAVVLRAVRWAIGRQGSRAENADAAPANPSEAALPSRREVLAGAAAALPPLLTLAAVGRAMPQLRDFRVRTIRVPIPGLPVELEGLTIAHVADVHVGRYTAAGQLAAIVEQTNALEPDLVLMTGDLIDHALADLPEGLRMVHQLRPKLGLFTCEGNHDLFEGHLEFERRVKAAGVRLLLNESETVMHRGQRIQILGLRWGLPGRRRSAMVDEHMRATLSLRRPDEFPILLAHHPHAFDPAIEAGIPLTLAGHTHGGQLMLTQDVGPGSMMYKYWSGLYQREASSLVVSNGVGNWFPLRMNAPAEIVHITLSRNWKQETGN